MKYVRYQGRLYRQADLMTGDHWRNQDSDIVDALDHASDFFEDDHDDYIDETFFDVERTEMSIEDLYYYDDIDAWLDVEEGELQGASREEILDWAEGFRGPQFAKQVDDFLTNGLPAIVVVNTPAVSVIGDGRGRLNLAVALGLDKIPVLMLTNKPGLLDG